MNIGDKAPEMLGKDENGRMMVSISMSVTGDWYVTVRTLTELPIIISKPPPSLRHPRTAAMRG